MIRKHFMIWGMVLLAATAPVLTSAESLRIGASSTLEVKSTYNYYHDLVKYVERKLGTTIELVLRERSKEVNDLLELGDIKIAIICPRSYVRNRDKTGVEILAVPQIDGQPYYHACIIVHKNSTIKDLAGLRGKRFAFTDQGSAAGDVAPAYLISRKFNKEPEKFFSTVQYVRSQDDALYLLASGDVDGVSVDSVMYDYSMRKKHAYSSDTRIIHTTPRIGVPPIVVKKSLDPAVKDRVRGILLSMHNEPEGKAILKEMGLDKFVVPKDSTYNSVRELDKWASKNL